MRANAIHLSHAQRWAVAKFCIENKGVTQDSSGKFTIFRVSPSVLLKEWLAQEKTFAASLHSIKDSVNFYNTICELTNNLPVVPEPDEMNSELETEYKKAIVLLESEKEKLQKTVADQNAIIANLLLNMQEIRKIAQSPGKTAEVKKLHGDNKIGHHMRG